MFPAMLWGQARLGKTEVEVRSTLSDVDFTRGWTKDGNKYLMAKLPQGAFIYYFNQDGKTNYNVFAPVSIETANAQAEVYNGKYTITSPMSWTAYLDGGGVMKIQMIYDEEYAGYIFIYTYL